jgi:hypothetical protein
MTVVTTFHCCSSDWMCVMPGNILTALCILLHICTNIQILNIIISILNINFKHAKRSLVPNRRQKRYWLYDICPYDIYPETFSLWANVFLGKPLLGKRLSGQMSSGQITFWENVVWANVSWQMSLGNSRMGKCHS